MGPSPELRSGVGSASLRLNPWRPFGRSRPSWSAMGSRTTARLGAYCPRRGGSSLVCNGTEESVFVSPSRLLGRLGRGLSRASPTVPCGNRLLLPRLAPTRLHSATGPAALRCPCKQSVPSPKGIERCAGFALFPTDASSTRASDHLPRGVAAAPSTAVNLAWRTGTGIHRRRGQCQAGATRRTRGSRSGSSWRSSRRPPDREGTALR